MTATNEQIMAEAWVRYRKANTATAVIGEYKPLDHFVIEVTREGWKPPEPVVDPDILAFREWFAQRAGSATKSGILAGHWDSISDADAYLAGARMARERERERAKVLVEFVGGVTTLGSNDSISAIVGVARFTLAKYRGEA